MSTQFNRARLLVENHLMQADSIVVSPTPSLGYEASNLADPDRTKLCKVVSTTMAITLNTSSTPWVHAVALTGLAYSPSATVTIMGNSEDQWAAPDFSNGTDAAYPAAFGAGAGRFGEHAMGGYLTKDVAPYFRPVSIIYFDVLQTHAWWRIVIDDPTGNGSVGVGIVGLCSMAEMSRNFSHGWEITPIDTTTKRRTTSGQMKTGRPGTRFDQVKLHFKNLPDTQKWFIHNKLKELGHATPWFLDMHPNLSGGDGPWTSLYGVTTHYGGLKVRGPNLSDFTLTFEEQPA